MNQRLLDLIVQGSIVNDETLACLPTAFRIGSAKVQYKIIVCKQGAAFLQFIYYWIAQTDDSVLRYNLLRIPTISNHLRIYHQIGVSGPTDPEAMLTSIYRTHQLLRLSNEQ